MRLLAGVAKLGQPHKAARLCGQAQGWGRLGVGLGPPNPMARTSPARDETNRAADAARAATPPPSAWEHGLGGHAKVMASNIATRDDIFIASILAPPGARVKPRRLTRGLGCGGAAGSTAQRSVPTVAELRPAADSFPVPGTPRSYKNVILSLDEGV